MYAEVDGMRSEKEIDEKIAELTATPLSFGTLVAVMVLRWVRGDNVGGLLSGAPRCAIDSCIHWGPLGVGGKMCESCGESLRLAPAQPPHAPATPPPKG